MSQVWKERLQCLGEGAGLAGLRDPCQLVRQLVGSGGRSFSHFDDERLQILPAEHETKTWRVKMAEAETPKGHHNPLSPSFLLKEPHFVGGHVPRLLAD